MERERDTIKERGRSSVLLGFNVHSFIQSFIYSETLTTYKRWTNTDFNQLIVNYKENYGFDKERGKRMSFAKFVKQTFSIDTFPSVKRQPISKDTTNSKIYDANKRFYNESGRSALRNSNAENEDGPSGIRNLNSGT